MASDAVVDALLEHFDAIAEVMDRPHVFSARQVAAVLRREIVDARTTESEWKDRALAAEALSAQRGNVIAAMLRHTPNHPVAGAARSVLDDPAPDVPVTVIASFNDDEATWWFEPVDNDDSDGHDSMRGRFQIDVPARLWARHTGAIAEHRLTSAALLDAGGLDPTEGIKAAACATFVPVTDPERLAEIGRWHPDGICVVCGWNGDAHTAPAGSDAG